MDVGRSSESNFASMMHFRLISSHHGGWKLYIMFQREDYGKICVTESEMNCQLQMSKWVQLAGLKSSLNDNDNDDDDCVIVVLHSSVFYNEVG